MRVSGASRVRRSLTSGATGVGELQTERDRAVGELGGGLVAAGDGDHGRGQGAVEDPQIGQAAAHDRVDLVGDLRRGDLLRGPGDGDLELALAAARADLDRDLDPRQLVGGTAVKSMSSPGFCSGTSKVMSSVAPSISSGSVTRL
jgi:hypothetical protein